MSCLLLPIITLFSSVVAYFSSRDTAYVDARHTPAVTLNRPKALNALCTPLVDELNTALGELNASDDVSAIVGSAMTTSALVAHFVGAKIVLFADGRQP